MKEQSFGPIWFMLGSIAAVVFLPVSEAVAEWIAARVRRRKEGGK